MRGTLPARTETEKETQKFLKIDPKSGKIDPRGYQNRRKQVPKSSQEATKEVGEAHSWLTKPLVKQTMVNFFG